MKALSTDPNLLWVQHEDFFKTLDEEDMNIRHTSSADVLLKHIHNKTKQINLSPLFTVNKENQEKSPQTWL